MHIKPFAGPSLFVIVVFIAPSSPGQSSRDDVHIGQGLMAGEVTRDSVILQSRLTSFCPYRDEDVRVDQKWSGVPGVRGVARFEISRNSEFQDSFETDWIPAEPEHDYIVKAKVANLSPGTRYYYRVRFGPGTNDLKISHTYAFKTHPAPTSVDEVSFAVVTGMNYSVFHWIGTLGSPSPLGRPDAIPPASGEDKKLGYPALAAILGLRPDYFIGTGDNVYYDTPALGRAETEHQMRMKYQEQFSQARFIDLFTEVATYWMKDDHDYRFCDSDPISPTTARTGDPNLPSHELGVRMFLEQLPVVDPLDPNPLTYRTHRVNNHLQLWFVEGRDYRSPRTMPDGPEKTLWGFEQRAWLKRTLLESDATFKILLSPTPMVGPDAANKYDSHVGPLGFKYEGDEFFRWLKDGGFLEKNFYIICGDRHWQYHAVHPSGFEEFSVGALVDQNASVGFYPGDEGSTDPGGKIEHVYHYPEPTGGFLMFSVNVSRSGQPEARFEFFNDHGKSLYTTTKVAVNPIGAR